MGGKGHLVGDFVLNFAKTDPGSNFLMKLENLQTTELRKSLEPNDNHAQSMLKKEIGREMVK